jgi:O-acetyl-ADP-ribose deacetylase (regulator of RNase III)
MSSIIRGDLLTLALEGRFDVIVHGCNCMCVMGAGIAKRVRAQFPEAYEADLETPKASRQKLGTISTALVKRGDRLFHVVNAYTQFDWRGTGNKADYEAIRNSMKHVKRTFSGKRIGYPQLGAGLAGGDWSVISEIISEELAGEDHTLVIYEAHQTAARDRVKRGA